MRERLRALGGGGEVRVEHDGAFATLWLDHPESANALSGKMLAELADAVDQLERWPGAFVVARGAGRRSFCAGADLRMVRDQLASPEDGLAMCRYMQGLTTRLADVPQVTVAAIEGAALGGGAELATAFDLRVVGARARLAFVQVRLGLSPGWGGGVRLVQLVGRQLALDLLGSGRSVLGEEAVALGLADAVAPDGSVVEHAVRYLERFSAGAPESVRAAKRVVRAASTSGQDEAFAVTARAFGDLWGGPANRRALAAHDKGRP